MKKYLVPLVVAVLALAGCGGTSHPQTPRYAPLAVGGHHCTPDNMAMQCVLAKLPPPAAKLLQAPFGAKYGWDFAWSCPSPAGKAFGVSYLSYDASKNWSLGCLAAYHGAGAATVAVWETSATRTLGGCSAGASDAREASRQLTNDQAPSGQPFDMAIDFDASGPDVAPYFQCASQAEPGRVNAYGGYRPLLYLSQHGLVGHLNWQTYAWSGGSWLPASIAPLEQYLNSSSVDYDRALAPDYAQWPRPQVGPGPDQVRRWIAARGKSLHAYYALCPSRKPVLGSGTCGKFAWRVNHFQKLIDTAHGYYPHCFGPHRDLGAAVCQIVRPAVAIRSRARDTTFKVLNDNAHGCESAHSRVHNQTCNLLWQRYDYFDHSVRRSVATSRL